MLEYLISYCLKTTFLWNEFLSTEHLFFKQAISTSCNSLERNWFSISFYTFGKMLGFALYSSTFMDK